MRQAHAAREIRDDGEGRCRFAQPVDAADPGKRLVAEAGEPAGALTQREFERRHGRQLAAQTEQLDRFTARLDDTPPFAKAVPKIARRRRCRSHSMIHILLVGMRELCRS